MATVTHALGRSLACIVLFGALLAELWAPALGATSEIKAAGSAATPSCPGASVSRMEAQTARLIKANDRFAAWAFADQAGRCYGMAALGQHERRHFEDLYLAGVYCLVAYGAGKDEPELAASDDGSLLLENDLVYSAGVLQSIAADDKAPADIRSNASSILSRLMVAVRPPAKKTERR
ncbi:MAG: hypothetical protein M3T49_00155 [Candidatus Eremiobacteraeota bacterium]|nr:hypothetical protein [Candidatus Eremiobacteraeota bacterium]